MVFALHGGHEQLPPATQTLLCTVLKYTMLKAIFKNKIILTAIFHIYLDKPDFP